MHVSEELYDSVDKHELFPEIVEYIFIRCFFFCADFSGKWAKGATWLPDLPKVTLPPASRNTFIVSWQRSLRMARLVMNSFGFQLVAVVVYDSLVPRYGAEPFDPSILELFKIS